MSTPASRFLSVDDYAQERSRMPEEVFQARFPASVIIARAGAEDQAGSDASDQTRRRADPPSPSVKAAVSIDGRSVVHAIAKDPTRPFPERVGVGRARGTDLWLPFEDVSKYHAFFTVERGVAVAVTDAGSTNGTFVRDERLEPRVAKPVEDGDVITFGRYAFLFATAEGFAKLLARFVSSSIRFKSGRPV